MRDPDRYARPWRRALDLYLEDFFRFFFPDAHREIDWSRPTDRLDGARPDPLPGTRYEDHVVTQRIRVITHGYEHRSVVVVIHIEVQALPPGLFAERMYLYHCSTFDRFRDEVVSLAVLTDESAEGRPTTPTACDRWGCRARLDVPTVELWLLEDRWQELEESKNPFAVLTMAHLKAQATHDDPEARHRWHLKLTRRLYEKAYEKVDFLHLHQLVHWVMTVPKTLHRSLVEDTQENEFSDLDTGMPMASFKKMGIHMGVILSLLDVLALRRLAPTEEQRVRMVSCRHTHRVRGWLERAAVADSTDEVFNDYSGKTARQTIFPKERAKKRGMRFVISFEKDGIKEGTLQSVLTVCKARGLDLTEDQRQQVLNCREEDRAHTLLIRAVRVDSVVELFAED